MKNIIFLTASLLLSLSADSMEYSRLKDISECYQHLAFYSNDWQLAKNKRALRIESNSAKEEADIVYSISPKEFDNSFYIIKSSVAKLKGDILETYNFFYENGFLVDLGIIEVEKLYAKGKFDKKSIFIKKALETQGIQKDKVEAGDKYLCIIPPKKPQYYFHKTEVGFFFRDNKFPFEFPQSKDTWLFQKNQELENLLGEVATVNDRIIARLKEIQKILHLNISPKTIFENLCQSEWMPELAIARIKRILNGNPNIIEISKNIIEFRSVIAKDIETCEERKISFTHLVAAPLDMTLLYGFYLFEDSHKFLYDESKTYFSFLSGIVAEDEFSIMTILSPNAFEVIPYLENLVPKKEPKPARKKRQPKEKVTIAIKNIDSIQATEEIVPVIKKSLKKNVYIDSLSDAQSSLNLKLARTKGHRLLDTLARMIASKLALKGLSPGSLSLILTKFPEDDFDSIVISTARDISEFQVIKAFKQAIAQLTPYSINDDFYKTINAEKNRIYELNEKLKNENNQKTFAQLSKLKHVARDTIDKIKLRRALLLGHDDILSQRIKSFFSHPHYLNQIVVVENIFRLHSEIRLISYAKAYNLSLELIPNNGNDIPYQYIGGSLRSCGQCTGLINGIPNLHGINEIANTKNMAFFVRGHYKASYPRYVMPPWALSVNEPRRSGELHKILRDANTNVNSFDKAALYNIQNAELSDSGEE